LWKHFSDESVFASTHFLVGQRPDGFDSQNDLAFSPDGSLAYLPGAVSDGGSFAAAVFIVDTSNAQGPVLQSVVEVEPLASRAAITLDGSRLYLLSKQGVFVFDTKTQEIVGSVETSAPGAAMIVGRDPAPPVCS